MNERKTSTDSGNQEIHVGKGKGGLPEAVEGSAAVLSSAIAFAYFCDKARSKHVSFSSGTWKVETALEIPTNIFFFFNGCFWGILNIVGHN